MPVICTHRPGAADTARPDLNDVKEVHYYFGRHFGISLGEFDTQYIVKNGTDGLSVKTNAYGPMLCDVRILSQDGTQTYVSRYIGFEGTAYRFEGYLKPRGLIASNASGAAPCRSARHTCDAAGRPRPPDPCIRRIQRDRNDSRLREMQRQRDSAKHHAANERCSDDC